jgi:hypothetical protein
MKSLLIISLLLNIILFITSIFYYHKTICIHKWKNIGTATTINIFKGRGEVIILQCEKCGDIKYKGLHD